MCVCVRNVSALNKESYARSARSVNPNVRTAHGSVYTAKNERTIP